MVPRDYELEIQRISLPVVSPAMQQVLLNALQDWSDVNWVLAELYESGVEDDALRRDAAVGIIGQMLIREWIVAGDIISGGFVAWPCSPGSAIERVTRELDQIALGEVTPGAVAWFDLTPAGQAVAESFLEQS